MAERDKENQSLGGIGSPENSEDVSASRPSKAAQAQKEERPSDERSGARAKRGDSTLGLGASFSNDPNAWRPSKAAQRGESAPSLPEEALEKQKRAERTKVRAHTQKCDAGSQTEGRTAENRASEAEQAFNPRDRSEHPGKQWRAAAWRPSKANEERLSSLSPVRARKRFAMSPRTRLIFTAVLFACGAYFFVELWLMPQAGELHVALLIAAVAMVLLFASAIVAAARRRGQSKRGDDQSTLRL